MDYAQPRTVDEALGLLSQGDWTILAGGTDYYPSLQDQAPQGQLLDVTRLGDLRGIRETETHLSIGALTTWSDVIAADLPAAFDALKLAAREVGSVQIQNRATVAGNLCNASPAADGVPPLLCLDAQVRLASVHGTRDLPLENFLTGYRATARTSDEMVTAILIPKSATRGKSHFAKLGARKYLVISIAMIAARIVEENGIITDAAVSIGACSVVARRLPELERALIGAALWGDIAGLVEPSHFDALSPIDDVRATAAYRQNAAQHFTRDVLSRIAA